MGVSVGVAVFSNLLLGVGLKFVNSPNRPNQVPTVEFVFLKSKLRMFNGRVRASTAYLIALSCLQPVISRGGAIDAGLWPIPTNVSSGGGLVDVSHTVRVVYVGAPCSAATHAQKRLTDGFDQKTG